MLLGAVLVVFLLQLLLPVTLPWWVASLLYFYLAVMGGLLAIHLFEACLESWLDQFRWYRRWQGGTYYLYELAGQLPGCYGEFWSRELLPPHRYCRLVVLESYITRKSPTLL